MSELNFEEDIKIDENELDVELLEQGEIALKYIREATNARKRAKKAEERTKTVRSELINEANEDPENTVGKAKPNAQDIEAYYRNHSRYQQAKKKEIEAQEEADFAEMARWEISYGRRKSLELLVQLHGQAYFAGPPVTRDLHEEREKRRQRTNAAISSVMQRGK